MNELLTGDEDEGITFEQVLQMMAVTLAVIIICLGLLIAAIWWWLGVQWLIAIMTFIAVITLVSGGFYWLMNKFFGVED